MRFDFWPRILAGHRSFHVFYFLLKGASAAQCQELQLLPPWDYRYLSCNDFRDDGERLLDYKDNYVRAAILPLHTAVL